MGMSYMHIAAHVHFLCMSYIIHERRCTHTFFVYVIHAHSSTHTFFVYVIHAHLFYARTRFMYQNINSLLHQIVKAKSDEKVNKFNGRLTFVRMYYLESESIARSARHNAAANPSK